MPDRRPTTSEPQDPQDAPATAQSITVDGVNVQVQPAATESPAETEAAAPDTAPPPRSPLRAALGAARRRGSLFVSSPNRPGDGDTRAEPPGRVPRPVRAGALIAGLVLVAGAFTVSGLYDSGQKRQRAADPANQLVGDPNNGDPGAVPGAVPAPLVSSASAMPSTVPSGDQGDGTNQGGSGGSTAGTAAGGAAGSTAGANGSNGGNGTNVNTGSTPKQSAAPAAPPPTTAANTKRIIGWQGLCIDVPGFNGVDGQRLQAATCNGQKAQSWTFPGDGTIRIYGLCMDIAWASTDNGSAIQLARCNGGWAQKFVLTGAKDLVNPHADKCVDVKNWGGSGSPLQLWECSGGGNQKWHLG